MYLTWANSLFLAFFAFNGINNLRVFNVAFSSIPTAPTKVFHSKRYCRPRNLEPGSDAGEPGIALFRGYRSQALADILQVVRNGDPREEFDTFITELPCNAQANGSAMRRGKFISVQGIGEQSLRMPRVGQLNRGK